MSTINDQLEITEKSHGEDHAPNGTNTTATTNRYAIAAASRDVEDRPSYSAILNTFIKAKDDVYQQRLANFLAWHSSHEEVFGLGQHASSLTNPTMQCYATVDQPPQCCFCAKAQYDIPCSRFCFRAEYFYDTRNFPRGGLLDVHSMWDADGFVTLESGLRKLATHYEMHELIRREGLNLHDIRAYENTLWVNRKTKERYSLIPFDQGLPKVARNVGRVVNTVSSVDSPSSVSSESYELHDGIVNIDAPASTTAMDTAAAAVAVTLTQIPSLLTTHLPMITREDIHVITLGLYAFHKARNLESLIVVISTLAAHFRFSLSDVNLLELLGSTGTAELQDGRSPGFESFMEILNVEEDQAAETSTETTSQYVSAFVNSPLGQRGLDFLGGMIGAGLIKREWVEPEINSVKLWYVPRKHIAECSVLTITDQFFKVVNSAVATMARCAAERSILPLAYDDQDARKFEIACRRIDSLAAHLSPGNLEELADMSEDDYGEILLQTKKLGERLLLRKYNPMVKKLIQVSYSSLSEKYEAYRAHVLGKDGKFNPFVICLVGGTGCGKTTVARPMTKALALYNGFSDKVMLVNEHDDFDTDATTDVSIVMYEDAANATEKSRGMAASTTIIKFTGPEPQKAVKADLHDKGKVTMTHKFLTVTTNVPDLDSHLDSHAPESIMRRLKNYIHVAPLPWLTSNAGSTWLSDERVQRYLGVPDDSAVQMLQIFRVQNPYVYQGESGVAEFGHNVVHVSAASHPKTYAMMSRSAQDIEDRSYEAAISREYGWYDENAHKRFVLDRAPSGALERITYDVLLCYLAEESEAHFSREKRKLRELNTMQHGANVCRGCMRMNAKCICPKKTEDSLQAGDAEVDVRVRTVQLPRPGRFIAMPFPKKTRMQRFRARVGELFRACTYVPEMQHIRLSAQHVDMSAWRLVNTCYRAARGGALSMLSLRCYANYWVEFARLLNPAVCVLAYVACFTVGHIALGPVCAFTVSPVGVLAVIHHIHARSYDRCLRHIEQNRVRIPQNMPQFRLSHVVMVAGVCAFLRTLVKKYFSKEGLQEGYNMRERKPLVVPEQGKTTSEDDFRRTVMSNIGKIYVRSENSKVWRTNCFCIGENVFVFPKHLMKSDVTHYKIQYNASVPKTWHPLVRDEVHEMEGRDIVAIRCHNAGTRKRVRQHFPETLGVHDGDRVGRMLFPKWDREPVPVSYRLGQSCPRGFKYGDTPPPDPDRTDLVHVYGRHTEEGDCFAVLVSEGRERSIVGFLIGVAVLNGQRWSVQETLSGDMVDQLIRDTQNECRLHMAEIAYTIPGLLERDPHPKSCVHHVTNLDMADCLGSYNKSDNPRPSIGPTLGTELVYKHLPVPDISFGPPPFFWKENGERNYPMTLALEDIVSTTARYVDEKVIVKDYLSAIRPVLPRYARGVLTDDEVVRGVQGENLSPMRMSTSAGYPHHCSKSRFATQVEDVWKLNDDVLEEYRAMDDLLRSGVRVPQVFRATLKNEPVLVGANKKARVFCAGPMISTMLVRKYFGPIIVMFHGPDTATECACGVDAVSPGWQKLFAEHEKRANAIAFDYKKFDRQVTAQMKSTVAMVLMLMLKDFPYSDEDRLAASTILMDYVEITLAIDGAMLRLMSMMPSGFPLTTICNSIDNSLRVRSALCRMGVHNFREVCNLTTYGDDAVLTTDLEGVNLKSLAESMRENGVTITGTDKDAALTEERLSLRETSFLSRRHVYHPDLGVWLGALEDKSLYKGILARDNGRRAVSAREHFVGASRSYIYELFAHGEERYTVEIQAMDLILKELGIWSAVPEVSMTYEDHCIRFCLNHNTAPVQGRFAKRTSSWQDYEEDESANVLMRGQLERDASLCASAIQRRVHPARHIKRPTQNGWFRSDVMQSPTTTMKITTTNENAQHTLTEFDDAMVSWHVGEHVDDPSRGGTDTSNLSIDEFLERPVKIYAERWTVNTRTVTINPWVELFKNSYNRNKLRGYRNMRASIDIKVIVNGTRFHLGKRVVAYSPHHTPSDVTFFGDEDAVAKAKATQLPHVSLNPTTSMGGEMTLPFFHHDDMLDLMTDDIEEMGSLILTTIVPLGIVGEGSPEVDVTVFARFRNVVLSGPTGGELAELQAGEIVDTPISSRLRSFANFSHLFRDVPVIGRYMRATEMLSSTASAVAAAYGYCAPPRMPQADKYYRGFGDSFASAHQESTAGGLTFNPKSEVTLDPVTAGLPPHDEMAFSTLCSRSSFVNRIIWSPDATSGSSLGGYSVNPGVMIVGQLDGTPSWAYTPLSFVSAPFQYWRGTMKYRFEVVGSAMHAGRLRVYHDSGVSFNVDASPYNTVRSSVIDISTTRDFTIEVPWASPEPYLLVSKSLATTYNSNTPVAFRGTHNGVLRIAVESSLVGPEVVASDVQLVVSVSSDDMEFWNPHESNVPRLSIDPRTDAVVPGGDLIQEYLGRGFTPPGPSALRVLQDPDGGPGPPDTPTRMPIVSDSTWGEGVSDDVLDSFPVSMLSQRIGNQGGYRWDFGTGAEAYNLKLFVYAGSAGKGGVRMRFLRNGNEGRMTIENSTGDILFDNTWASTDDDVVSGLLPADGLTPFQLHELDYVVRHYSLQPKLGLVSMKIRSNPNIGLVAMEKAELIASTTGGVDNGAHVSSTSDFVIDPPDRHTGYSMVVSTRTPPVVNGQTYDNPRGLEFVTYTIPPTAGPITIGPNDIRSLQYVALASLQSGQVEDQVEHAPDTDMQVKQLGEASIPVGLNTICYDDPIVSYRTMLKRCCVTGLIGARSGTTTHGRPMYPSYVIPGFDYGTRVFSMMGFVQTFYKGVRGSVRKKLVPLTKNIQVVQVQRFAPTNEVSSVTNTRLLLGTSGMEMFPGDEVAHVSVPYHAPVRYMRLGNGTNRSQDDLRLGYNTRVIASSEAMLAECTSAGEDYNLFFFAGSPRFFAAP